MKSLSQMDLEDWEILPDDGFLEIHDDDGGNKIYSRKHHHHHHPSSSNSSVFQMNYFIVPPTSTPQFVDTTKVPNHLVPVPFDLQQEEHDELVKKESKQTAPVEIKMIMPLPEKMNKSFEEEDQDPVSQVFFKKMKETEFVDMKVESPKSSNSTSRAGIMIQIEGGSAGAFQFEENGDPCKDDDDDDDDDSEMEMKKKNNVELDLELEERDDEGGLNIWKWSLSGVGAICSFGVAAVCIIVLSSTHQKMNKHPRRHNQKQLQFQMYSNDKRMKQVVVQHANKLNEAISAARGAAINRARITVGGYHDASL